MKKTFLLLLTVLPVLTFAQRITEIDFLNDKNEIEFTEIYLLEGRTQKELYQASKLFIANNTQNPQEAIQIDDEGMGLILVNGSGEFSCLFLTLIDYNINYSVKFESKEGKTRITINNVTFSSNYTYEANKIFVEDFYFNKRGQLKKPYDCLYANMLTHVRGFLDMYIEFLNTNFAEKEDSDW